MSEQATKTMEIETKRFIDIHEAMTVIEGRRAEFIEQGFLNRPGSDFLLRVRRSGIDITTALKLGGNKIARQEIETTLDSKLYEFYAPYFIGDTIQKVRYEISEGTSLDLFVGQQANLSPILEVESLGNSIDQSVQISQASELFNVEIAQGGIERVEGGSLENLTKQAETIAKTLQQSKKPLTVAVGGPSGSGKSTFTRNLIENLLAKGVSTTIVEIDDYRTGNVPIFGDPADDRYNWDHPTVYDTEAVAKDLDLLKANQDIDARQYDFIKWKTNFTGKKQPAEIVIVDGLYAMSDEILLRADLSIVVDANIGDCLKRRIERDHFSEERSVRWDETESLYYYMSVAWPTYLEHLAPQHKKADLIINN